MRMRTFVLVAVLLSVGSALHAQEPVVGVKDPESLFKDSDPVLNRNKQAALHIMRELLQCGQWDRASEWLTDAYHPAQPERGVRAQGRRRLLHAGVEGQARGQVRQADDGSRRGDGRR